jgi:hypothetical protein
MKIQTNWPRQTGIVCANKGKHALYEGDEKSQYTCKNCGQKSSSLSSLTSASCFRHPDGANKGKHEPAL